MVKIYTSQEKEDLQKLISKFKILTWPNQSLTKEIMELLGLYEIVDLEFTLNSRDPRERLAGMKMIERYLVDLISGVAERYNEAKDTLQQIYYKVSETDEEAIL